MAGPTAGVKQLRGVMQLCYSWLAKGRRSFFDDPAFSASEFQQHINKTRNPARQCGSLHRRAVAVIKQELRVFVVEAARQGGFTSSSAQGRQL